ncbi:MAG: M24 family metallopeptidase [Bacillota bacterium]
MAAIESIKAGIPGTMSYEEAKEIFVDTGYLDYHYSGLDHGVGLFVHERPFMGPVSKDVLEKNGVVTVEPGIYIPNWGGVRIEDMVLIKENGYEILTDAPRELLII